MNVGNYLCILMILLFSLAGCSEKEKRVEKEPLRFVRYEVIKRSPKESERLFSAVAHASNESKLSFKIPGTVKKIRVKVGDRIRKGQLIARLDDETYRLQKEQAEASVERIKIQLANLEKVFKRFSVLIEKNAIPENDFDNISSKYEAAKAGLKAAEKQLELATLQLSYTNLYSTVDGYVAYKNGEEGENIGAGMPLFIVNSMRTIDVKFSVPESLISQLKKDDSAKVSFDALDGMVFQGKLYELGVSTLASLPTTFPVTVRLEGKVDKIRSGMTARVELSVKNGDDAGRIFVPSHSVGEDRQGRFVYVAVRDNEKEARVERRPVKIGDTANLGIEIVKGLKPGEILVTAGVHFLENGMKVRLD